MLENEEKYIHFVSCIDDLNNAWRILRLVRQRKKNSLRHIAFKFALIEYSKPYLRSEGTIKKNLKIDKGFIPAEHIELHNRIIAARNKFLAHSDLTIRDATLFVFQNESRKFPIIGQTVIHGSEEFDNIDEIIELIEKSLENMYEERDRLEVNLQVNEI